MTYRIPLSVLVLLLTIGASGCSIFKVEANVSSTTSWSGTFHNRTVSGTGDMKVDMGARGGGAKCAVVQKETRQGTLTVSISGGETATTTAEFGVVSVCTQ